MPSTRDLAAHGVKPGERVAVWLPSRIESVIALIAEKKRRGVAIVAIVHDGEVRDAVADRLVDVLNFAAAA